MASFTPATLLALAAALLLPGASGMLTPKADALVARRGLRGLEEAVSIYSSALEAEKDNVDLKMKLLDALNGVMRVKTNSNTIAIDRLQDTPANKKVWAELGPRALELASAVRDARPNDVRAAAMYADAFMYSCSSKGIIKQALSGAATVFKTNAERILALDKTYDSGVGYAFMGCFYAIAPWPIGSLEKAATNLDLAVQVAPSLRNLYYVGVVAYKRKEWEKSADSFRKARLARPGSPTEGDFADFMRAECERALPLVEAELKSCAAGKGR